MLRIYKLNKFNSGFIAFIIIFFSYLYATPYLSIFIFKYSIEREDVKTASEYIDFDSVRNSLKSQIKLSLNDKIKSKKEGRLNSEIRFRLFNPIINFTVESIVDSTVTVKGLDILINKGVLIKDLSQENSLGIKKESDSDNRIKLYYKNPNKFILSSQVKEIEDPIKAIWSRENLFKWKLSFIELPNQIFSKIK